MIYTVKQLKTIYSQFAHLLVLSFIILYGCNRESDQSIAEQSVEAPVYQGTVIVLGDSLSAGLGVAENDAWPALLEMKLQSSGFNWQVINAGISGETSSGALSRIKWILAQEPDIVILETGANDGLRGIPIGLVRENIGAAVRQMQEHKVTVVLAGMQIVQNLGAEYAKAFADIYPAVAEETGCLLIPFLLQGVVGEKELNQADTIHPNEKGHMRIAETVFPFIRQSIGQRQ